MGILESPWEPLGALGSSWELLGILGMEVLGSPWELLGACGSSWESLRVLGWVRSDPHQIPTRLLSSSFQIPKFKSVPISFPLDTYHQPSSAISHQPSAISHQPSSAIISHHQPSSAIIRSLDGSNTAHLQGSSANFNFRAKTRLQGGYGALEVLRQPCSAHQDPKRFLIFT